MSTRAGDDRTPTWVFRDGDQPAPRAPFDRLDHQFTAGRELGLRAVVNELDLAVVPRHRWWAGDGARREELAAADPYAAGCPAVRLRE